MSVKVTVVVSNPMRWRARWRMSLIAALLLLAIFCLFGSVEQRKLLRPLHIITSNKIGHRVWDDFPLESVFPGGSRVLSKTSSDNTPNSLHLSKDTRLTGPHANFRPKKYDPYPRDTHAWRQDHVPCLGPRGDELRYSMDDQVYAYDGVPAGFPSASIGSHNLLGLDDQVCFDRYNRFGAYGYGEDEDKVASWVKPSPVDWHQVNWGELQKNCTEHNQRIWTAPRARSIDDREGNKTEVINQPPRTAILLRSWIGYNYAPNDFHVFRAIITELSLMTGGQYSVYLLIHTKGKDISTPEKYEEVKRASVPREFMNITELWSEKMWESEYPKQSEHWDVFHSQWFPVQRFARRHPEFDFFWNWEMDVRYTGHHYHLLEQLHKWTKAQPRKFLWERSARFYIPRQHGSYDEDFRSYVEEVDGDQESVWGPVPVDGVTPRGPQPPVARADDDNYQWGVGEDADLITLLPMFVPQGTGYSQAHDAWDYGDETLVPRRAAIVTVKRLSRRLLETMEYENVEKGHHMGAEMWPEGAALHHGFKAVYAPHPILMDRHWPAQIMENVFNPGPRGQSGDTWDSPFHMEREHNFLPSTWYYRADSAEMLYRQYLGYEEKGSGGVAWEKKHGRVCLPGVLLHPVKNTDPLVVV